ncbi:hypothetical protein [Flavisphingomonas formosensis]|uniref:hypothetical protein n=1 Tax=Flavisphingomonas formosensis TaxID=861534 RepID=UPI0012FC8FC2|nr:hypothetical protein [Sphingomonas formosensis]
MVKSLFAAVLLASLPVAASAAQAPRAYVADGVRYIVQRSDQGGAVLLRGRNIATGEQFDLTVADGRIFGTYGGHPVDAYPEEAMRIAQFGLR